MQKTSLVKLQFLREVKKVKILLLVLSHLSLIDQQVLMKLMPFQPPLDRGKVTIEINTRLFFTLPT